MAGLRALPLVSAHAQTREPASEVELDIASQPLVDVCLPMGLQRNQTHDPHSRYQVVGIGPLTEEEAMQLADEKRVQLGR